MIVSFLVLKPSLIMSKNDNLINCILNQLVESWFQSILSYLKVVLNQISCLKLKVIDLICTTQFHLVPPSIGGIQYQAICTSIYFGQFTTKFHSNQISSNFNWWIIPSRKGKIRANPKFPGRWVRWLCIWRTITSPLHLHSNDIHYKYCGKFKKSAIM